MKSVARYADCRLLHLSCQHVGAACPHHHPCPQLTHHHPGRIATRNNTMLGTNYWNTSRSRAAATSKIQQCLKEEEQCKDGTDVPCRTGRHPHVHGVVTDRCSYPREIGEGAHGSKQSVLLERMARLVAVSDVVHSFSSDQPRLRVDGRLSNRNVHEDRGESGRARLEQLVKRVGRHADGCPPPAAAAASSRVSPAPTSAKPSLASFSTRSPASWRHHDGARPRCCATHWEEDSSTPNACGPH